MLYKTADFSEMIGLNSLSEEQLKLHFGLYEKYVAQTNKIMEKLDEAAAKSEGSLAPETAELRRRLGWEWNGMRLHEYYFENLIKDGSKIDKNSTLSKQIEQDFGSFEAWKKDFINTASLRGNGWAILYFDLEYGRLLNIWVDQHNINHPAGAVPILVIDAWEHAYMVDYKTDRAAYLEKVMTEIDWEIAEERFGLEELVEEDEE